MTDAARSAAPNLDPAGFDGGATLPDPIGEAAARAHLERQLRRSQLTQPRRDPLSLPTSRQYAADLTYVAGGLRDGQPVAVWRFVLVWSSDPSVAPVRTDLSDRHLMVGAVTPGGGSYHAIYPPDMGPITDAAGASELAVVDGFLYAEREGVLDPYRQRCGEAPRRWRPHYELAMVAAASSLDLLPLPGPPGEAVEAAEKAALRAKKQANPQALLGWLLELGGRCSAAADAYGRAAELKKGSSVFAYAWADNLLFADRFEEARRAFEEAHRRARDARGETLEPGPHRPAVVDRIKAWVLGQGERIRAKREGRGTRTAQEAVLTEQRELLAFDPEQVPAPFRHLVPLVEAWAIGDDAVISEAVAGASRADKRRIRAALRGHRRALNDWLDTFAPQRFPPEAVAFMTFLLACEEMDI
ncbi:MAG: hypothetical protein AAGN66_22855 [Acidobacteriota bacterium]